VPLKLGASLASSLAQTTLLPVEFTVSSQTLDSSGCARVSNPCRYTAGARAAVRRACESIEVILVQS
jgi:hypothetical protein